MYENNYTILNKIEEIKNFLIHEAFYMDYKRDMITQILKNVHELNVDLAKKIVNYYEQQI